MTAELYALTHRGNAGDVAFYGEICKGARRVLELGAGSGRILSALASARRQIVGLELDRELLALAKRGVRALPAAKRKSVQLVHGDMRSFELEPRFDRVLLPYNALYCLLSKRDALACFRAARRALEPGGTLALDVWNAQSFHDSPPSRANESEEDGEPIVTLQHARHTWDVFEQTRVWRSRQRLDASYTYLPRAGGTPQKILIRQRYYLAPEVTDLLQRAGFEIQARYGDFSGRRFAPRSPQLVVLARAR